MWLLNWLKATHCSWPDQGDSQTAHWTDCFILSQTDCFLTCAIAWADFRSVYFTFPRISSLHVVFIISTILEVSVCKCFWMFILIKYSVLAFVSRSRFICTVSSTLVIHKRFSWPRNILAKVYKRVSSYLQVRNPLYASFVSFELQTTTHYAVMFGAI